MDFDDSESKGPIKHIIKAITNIKITIITRSSGIKLKEMKPRTLSKVNSKIIGYERELLTNRLTRP